MGSISVWGTGWLLAANDSTEDDAAPATNKHSDNVVTHTRREDRPRNYLSMKSDDNRGSRSFRRCRRLYVLYTRCAINRSARIEIHMKQFHLDKCFNVTVTFAQKHTTAKRINSLVHTHTRTFVSLMQVQT